MKIIIALMLVAGIAQAETVITPHGTYVVQSSASTTYVTGPRTGSSVAVIAPVQVNPATGIGQVHTPQGSYIVSRQGSTTTYIQTSKSK